jgi:hypothetical protein
MAMRVPRTDYEWDHPSAGVTEEEFDNGKTKCPAQDDMGGVLAEGINGWARMNTKFENTERVQVLAPRGDMRGRPMPRDAKFSQAGNHYEWGPDEQHEALDCGMDGPNETRSYHGAGLPRRQDLYSNANPQFGGAGSGMSAAEDNPADQGLNSKTP